MRVDRLVNGARQAAYSCPCGRFADDGVNPMSGKPVSQAELHRRYRAHLELR